MATEDHDQQPVENETQPEEDTYEQDIKKVMEDGPDLDADSSTVQGGTPTEMSAPSAISTSASSTLCGTVTSPVPSPPSEGTFASTSITHVSSKHVTLKERCKMKIKCTKQLLSEKLGKGDKTVDLEMNAQIEMLRDTQQKYANVLRMATALTNNFFYVIQAQRALGETFSDLAKRSPELQEEFLFNSETQKVLAKNGDILLGALNFFTSSVNTLCTKTMEDTFLTVKQYEAARLEYDAYRNAVDNVITGPKDWATSKKLEESRKEFDEHKIKFEQLREDVAIKLKLLEENKVKVMHKQLVLFQNAVSAYFSGNEAKLETALKQFSIKLKSPDEDKTSSIVGKEN